MHSGNARSEVQTESHRKKLSHFLTIAKPVPSQRDWGSIMPELLPHQIHAEEPRRGFRARRMTNAPCDHIAQAALRISSGLFSIC
jgi:hypothetical protein